MRKFALIPACWVALLLFGLLPGSADSTSNVALRISGKAALEEGQLYEAYNVGPESEKMPYPTWINRSYAQIRLDAQFGKRLRITVAPEVRLWGNTYAAATEQEIMGRPFRQFSYVSIYEAEGILSFGNPEKPFLQFAAGVMPFKYNPDARNLGEYLFRSGAYSPYIITSFDYSYAPLTGLRLHSALFDTLNIDLFLTTETNVQPLLDWSLSGLVTYDLFSYMQIGVGASLYRIFPMSNGLTTPKNALHADYITATGDTSYYSFSGTKLMGRISLNLKQFLPAGIRSLFGSEDAKIFAEAAVLGLKNYPAYIYDEYGELVKDTVNDFYGDVSKRIPIMFGINLPVFKVLDVLCLQAEWFGWEYGNSLYSCWDYKKVVPVPVSMNVSDLPEGFLKNNKWAWSVYTKKEVIKGFSIIGQIAHDHTFNDSYYEANYSPVQAFIAKGGWGWWAKLQYAF